MSPSFFLRFIFAALASFFCLTITALPLRAEDRGSDSWEFHLAPYAWLAGQNGSVATLPRLPPADIDIDFYDDILGNINGAVMLAGTARKGLFGVAVDAVYTDIESDGAVPGPVFTTLSSRTTSWIVSAQGSFRVLENDKASLDSLLGVRYWSVESELALRGGPAGFYSVNNSESWFDPTVGLKGYSMLGGSRFFVSGVFLIGGFGVGSDFMWDVNANLGYQWTDTFSTTIGYRYLDVDYEDGGFLYDVSQDGVILGLSWRF